MQFNCTNSRVQQQKYKKALIGWTNQYPSYLNCTLTFNQRKKQDYSDPSEMWEPIDIEKANACLTQFCNRLSRKLFSRSQYASGYRITMIGHLEGKYGTDSAGQRLHFHGHMGNFPTIEYDISQESGKSAFEQLFKQEWSKMPWSRTMIDLQFNPSGDLSKSKTTDPWRSYSAKKAHYSNSDRFFVFAPKDDGKLLH